MGWADSIDNLTSGTASAPPSVTRPAPRDPAGSTGFLRPQRRREVHHPANDPRSAPYRRFGDDRRDRVPPPESGPATRRVPCSTPATCTAGTPQRPTSARWRAATAYRRPGWRRCCTRWVSPTVRSGTPSPRRDTWSWSCTTTVGAMTIVGEYGSGLIRTLHLRRRAGAPVGGDGEGRRTRRGDARPGHVHHGEFVRGVPGDPGRSGRALDARRSRGAPGPGRDPLAATALLAPVCALIGMGLGALIRHTPASVGAALAVLVLLPMVVDSDRIRWVTEVGDRRARGAPPRTVIRC